MNELKTIGNYLTKQSICILKNTKLKDAFIRSAYNRYYYSCFLRARVMIKEVLNSNLQYHRETKGKIKEIYNKEKKRYKNTDDEEVKNHLETLNTVCDAFIHLMETAKEARSFADYYWGDEKDYEKIKSRLGSISIINAEKWLEEVEEYIYLIQRIRGNLGH